MVAPFRKPAFFDPGPRVAFAAVADRDRFRVIDFLPMRYVRVTLESGPT